MREIVNIVCGTWWNLVAVSFPRIGFEGEGHPARCAISCRLYLDEYCSNLDNANTVYKPRLVASQWCRARPRLMHIRRDKIETILHKKGVQRIVRAGAWLFLLPRGGGSRGLLFRLRRRLRHGGVLRGRRGFLEVGQEVTDPRERKSHTPQNSWTSRFLQRLRLSQLNSRHDFHSNEGHHPDIST